MNEEALRDAYELFKGGGYNGSFEDYKNLINVNPNALEDSYKLFTGGGYEGSIDDFSVLVGVKKKEDSEASQSSDSPFTSLATARRSFSIPENPSDAAEEALSLEELLYPLTPQEAARIVVDEEARRDQQTQGDSNVPEFGEAPAMAQAQSDEELAQRRQGMLAEEMRVPLESAGGVRVDIYTPYIDAERNLSAKEAERRAVQSADELRRQQMEEAGIEWGATGFTQGGGLDVGTREAMEARQAADEARQMADEETRTYSDYIRQSLLQQLPEEIVNDSERLAEVEGELFEKYDIRADLTGDGVYNSNVSVVESAASSLERSLNDLAYSAVISARDLASEMGAELPPESAVGLEQTREQRLADITKKIRDRDRSLSENLEAGNFAEFGSQILDITAESTPTMAAAAAVTFATKNPQAGMAVLGGLTASTTYADAKNQPWFKEMDTWQQIGYVSAVSGAEVLGEWMGAKAIMRAARGVTREAGNEAAQQTLREFIVGQATAMGVSVSENGVGEAITGITQYVANAAAQGEDITMDGIVAAGKESLIAGVGMGGGISGAGSVVSAPVYLANRAVNRGDGAVLDEEIQSLSEQFNNTTNPTEKQVLAEKIQELSSARTQLVDSEVEAFSNMSEEDLREYERVSDSMEAELRRMEDMEEGSAAWEIAKGRVEERQAKLDEIKERNAIQEQEPADMDADEQAEPVSEVEEEVRSEEEPTQEGEQEEITVESFAERVVNESNQEFSEAEQDFYAENQEAIDTRVGELRESKPVDSVEVVNDENTNEQESEDTQEPEPYSVELTPNKKPLQRLLDFVKRNLYSDRNASTEEIFQLRKDLRGGIAKELNRATANVKSLNRSIKKEGVEPSAVEAVLRGESDPSTLPESVAENVATLRAHIDGMSRRLINEGLVSESLAATIEENIGAYLTRSYEVYDSKNFRSKIKEKPKVVNKAAALIRKQVAPEVEQRVLEENPNATRAEIDEAIKQRVTTAIEDIITDRASVDPFVKAYREGSKNLSPTKRRMDIPKAIRDLMGEYQDPSQNYINTIKSLSGLLYNSVFLSELRDMGMGTFFFEKADPKRPTNFNTKIAAEGSETMAPLNGLYTSKEIAQELETAAKQFPEWLKQYMKLIGSVKYSKTILSPVTHLKNVYGNLGFVMMNGDLNPIDFQKSWKLSMIGNGFERKGKNWSLKDKKKFREQYQRYLELGVVSQSASLGELRDFFEKSTSEDTMTIKNINNIFVKKMKQAARGIENLYQAEDDFFKIVAFESQSRQLARAYYGKPKSELTSQELEKVEREAADIVRDTYPTYDMVPKVVKALNKFPFLGTFISFQAESLRVWKNSVSIAIKQSTDSNPEIRKMGARRLAGIGLYTSVKTAIIQLMANAAGMSTFTLASVFSGDYDEQEDKDVRQFLPPWMKNSELVFFPAEDGKLSVIDLSGSDPYGSIYSAGTGIKLADNPEEAARAVGELFDSFYDTDIFTNELIQQVTNEDDFGRPIANTSESGIEQLVDRALSIAETFEPGGVKTIRRMADENRDFSKELKSALTGTRVYEIDIAEQFSYQARDFADKIKNAERDFRSSSYGALRGEQLSSDERDNLRSEYEGDNSDLIRVLREASENYQAALRLGADRGTLIRSLTNARIPRKYLGQIISGRVLEAQPITGSGLVR